MPAICRTSLVPAFILLISVTWSCSGVRSAHGKGDEYVYKSIEATDEAPARDMRIYVTSPGKEPAGPTPAIVFFHGGGWTGGAPGQFSEHAAYFASRGLVCFQVEYRLLGKKSNEAPDTCIEDAIDAMRWVRKKADDFHVDPNRIASGGGSAGGHLAAYLGCNLAQGNPAKPAAMLLFNPVYDNGPGGWGTKRVGEKYRKYSPAHNLTPDDPPSIVFLGSNDKLIPVATAEKFAKECESAGVKSKLVVYPGQGHGFFNSSKSDGLYYRKTVIESDQFLQSLGWLQGSATLKE